jgi:hypothetical protein
MWAKCFGAAKASAPPPLELADGSKKSRCRVPNNYPHQCYNIASDICSLQSKSQTAILVSSITFNCSNNPTPPFLPFAPLLQYVTWQTPRAQPQCTLWKQRSHCESGKRAYRARKTRKRTRSWTLESSAHDHR